MVIFYNKLVIKLINIRLAFLKVAFHDCKVFDGRNSVSLFDSVYFVDQHSENAALIEIDFKG
jgi:hypothetical protein